MPALQQAFRAAGVSCWIADQDEADDLAATLAVKICNPVITGDASPDAGFHHQTPPLRGSGGYAPIVDAIGLPIFSWLFIFLS
jgi:hypothetical protein